jgi:transcription elongation factor GreA
MEQQYLTQERFNQLKEALQQLKTVKRKDIAERLKRAKELGDLSENAEYSEAREEQSQVEKKIFDLDLMLKQAEVIKKVKGGIVQVGSTIKVKKGTEEFQFTIVGSNEARPEDGFISNVSPLGKSFLDKRVGEKVNIKVPAGDLTYEILAIK